MNATVTFYRFPNPITMVSIVGDVDTHPHYGGRGFISLQDSEGIIHHFVSIYRDIKSFQGRILDLPRISEFEAQARWKRAHQMAG